VTEARFSVEEGGSPNLGTAPSPPAASEADPATSASVSGEPAPAPGWTPEEAAGLASGLVSVATGIHAIVTGIPVEYWERHLRGDPAEWAASSPTLARRLDELLPRAVGGPVGLVADAAVVGNDALLVTVRRRTAVVAWRQHQAAQQAYAKPASRAGAAAPAPPAADEGLSYRLPADLAAVAAAAATDNGLGAMGMG
jgi:hypothetical protein